MPAASATFLAFFSLFFFAAATNSTIDIETRKIHCLRFVMCPLLEPGFQGFFFDVAVSTNEANKAGGTPH